MDPDKGNFSDIEKFKNSVNVEEILRKKERNDERQMQIQQEQLKK